MDSQSVKTTERLPEFENKVHAAEILIHELAHYCGGKQHSERIFSTGLGLSRLHGAYGEKTASTITKA